MIRSIRSKVLLATISITLITVLSITIVFYIKSSDMIEKNYGENLYARVRQMGDAFDNSLKEIYYLTVQASCDDEVIERVQAYRGTKDESELEQIALLLQDYLKRYQEIGSVYLVFPGEQVIVTSQDYPVYEKKINTEVISQIDEASSVSITPKAMRDPLRDSSYILSFVSMVTDEEGRVIAYVMNNMDERMLYYQYLDSLDEGERSHAVILDADSEIISAKNQDEIGIKFQNETWDGTKDEGILNEINQSMLAVVYRTPFTGYHFFMEVEKKEILGDLREIRYFLAMFLLLFCGVSAVIAYFITGAMHKPLKNLTDTMEQISQGELEQRVEITTNDEIGILSRDFNNMLEHIEELIGQLVKEEMLKKDAELEALQYQITPHFMYNTLNSIKYAAILKGEKEIGGLVEDFVELLQASINKKGTFVTVAEELHFLENYVSLQRVRYEGKFIVKYRVEPEASGCFLPRLMLQPLVENAILHGLDMKNDNSQITVTAWTKEDTLYVSVKDNGRGMTKEQIVNLLESKKEKKTSGLSGIGVVNVKERLNLYYGEAGGISYESGSGGTTASLYLPAYKEQGKYAL